MWVLPWIGKEWACSGPDEGEMAQKLGSHCLIAVNGRELLPLGAGGSESTNLFLYWSQLVGAHSEGTSAGCG